MASATDVEVCTLEERQAQQPGAACAEDEARGGDGGLAVQCRAEEQASAAATATCRAALQPPEPPGTNAQCPFCGGSTGRWWPVVRAPLWCGTETGEGLVSSTGVWLCHLECLCYLFQQDGTADSQQPQKIIVDAAFAEELRQVVELSPQLFGQGPQLRLCYEEARIALACDAGFPPPGQLPAPPPATFALEGLVEIRISSCPELRRLPPEIGRCYGIKGLVLISNGLVEICPEVGQLSSMEQLFLNGNFIRTLPEEVCNLPVLQEFCIDSNIVEWLPPLTSPRLHLITAPSNKLKVMPRLCGRLSRLDVHGNFLTTMAAPGCQAQWHSVTNIKLMGNRICELPPEIGQMRGLRTLLVGGNQLKSLPDSLAELRFLEWLFAYRNEIRDLPEGLLRGCQWLDRVLLEGNPLSYESMDGLFRDAEGSKVRALALDEDQVRSYVRQRLALTARGEAAGAAEAEAEAPVDEVPWRPLPACVAVGSLVHSGNTQCYMKLVRASQLRRGCGTLATGEPGAPDGPEADLLVVAFAASQGEPEWLGVLRRLAAEGGRTLPPSLEQPPWEGPVENINREAVIAALWEQCGSDPGEAPPPEPRLPPIDFDVLAVIDHRMKWYADPEEEASLRQSLVAAARKHKYTLMVGASMGGFGALLHGGVIADGVLAFGPQACLQHATLRPPAPDLEALSGLSGRVRDSVRCGQARGALVEVHCAADEHGYHALTLPLNDLSLTTHPLLPRKPFARLLDRAEILDTILADAVYRLLRRPPAERAGAEAAGGAAAGGPDDALGPCDDSNPGGDRGSEPRVLMARWGPKGTVFRHRVERKDMLQLFFRSGVSCMPRPGDWFCPRCHLRNMSTRFFCHTCGLETEGARIMDAVAKVPGGRDYPRRGDWGCGKCGTACCGYEGYCSSCWGTPDHENSVVVE